MKKLFWKAAVCLFLTLAMIGALLPGMPTTVFLILAAWAASKGWPEMDAWLMAHPKYGLTLRNWREHGTVSRKVKIIACSMIVFSAILMSFTNAPFWVKVFTILIMLAVSIWLLTRPEVALSAKSTKENISNSLSNNHLNQNSLNRSSLNHSSLNQSSLNHSSPEQSSTHTAQQDQLMTPSVNDLGIDGVDRDGLDIKAADVLIDLSQQRLYLPKQNKHYVISSGLNGIGEQQGSGKTPRGWHRICEKFGADAPENAVFVARQWTGEVYTAELALNYPERDWILSRVLWLEGLQAGFNQGDGCDSKARYIYIHGTPDSEAMGQPRSHGCIRMRNADVIELFNHLPVNALVYIATVL